MSELLLELYSEEIPSRMQLVASNHLRSRICDGLDDLSLPYESVSVYSTPRRLALRIDGIATATANSREEKRGPREGSPASAIQGFLKSAGLSDISEAEIREDSKKGNYYVAVIEHEGRPAQDILREIIVDTINKFSWQKSMKWGGSGNFRWVRPLESILCIFAGEIIDFEIAGIKSGDKTQGHRFYDSNGFSVSGFSDYEKKLKDNFVILDVETRKKIIKSESEKLASSKKLEVMQDEELLDEVAGLVEFPKVLLGTFDESYLELPDEIIRATIRQNQKCFVLKNKNGLSNQFILVSNIKSDNDNGKEVIQGNVRVVNARLADAQFFFDSDVYETKQSGFDNWIKKLDGITFHNKLGTQGDRVRRIVKLASLISNPGHINSGINVGSQGGMESVDRKGVERAARICKADLCSAVVGDFPSLQGVMGRIYSQGLKEFSDVSVCCEEHYRPQGPRDNIPSSNISAIVALADKIDMLCEFWRIGEKPTGSKDPFALRRAALGIIRIILDRQISLSWQYIIEDKKVREGVLLFLFERLKFYWRDTGYKYDLIDAVMSGREKDFLVSIDSRLKALNEFIEKEGKGLLQSHKRVSNILSASKMKESKGIDEGLFRKEAEDNLYEKFKDIKELEEERIDSNAGMILTENDCIITLRHLSEFVAPLDKFFDEVMVNDEREDIRTNRLSLLFEIDKLMGSAADFSKIEG